MNRNNKLYASILFFIVVFCYNSIFAQPNIDGTFDGQSVWGTPVSIANLSAGWASANAKRLYATEDACYLYLGAEVTASNWMSWAFIINTKAGGGTADSWSRSIDYTHTNKPDFIFRGTFGGYAEFHTWSGSSWSGTGSAKATTEFGENITGTNQDGWVEVRIFKSLLGTVSAGDIQFFITGDQNAHGSFDAIPNDNNATSWNEASSRTQLSNYVTNITIGAVQTVTVVPATPTTNEQVTITFNANCTDLAGATKVYFHSGVSTNPNNALTFSKVVGNWGQDDGIGEMTNIGTNLWQIVLPSLRSYYNVDSENDIFGLNFLFRNANGSLKEDQSGVNYFNAVNTGNFFTLTSPTYSPFLIEINTFFTASAQANTAPISWTLQELDMSNNVITTITSQAGGITFSHNITLTDTNLKRYSIQADFGASEVRNKRFEAKAYSAVNLAARPSWTKPGINYHIGDDTKATLVLHAPVYTRLKNGNGTVYGSISTPPKQVVYVLGDFNNWTISEAYKMNRDRDGWDGTTDADNDNDRGDYWWIELTGLMPGEDYVFQYLIDGGLQVADPYAEQISDIDDANISSTRYPNLPIYPTQAQDRASVLRTAQTTYNWVAPPFTSPSPNKLNIYELHFRDFTAEGTYLAAIDRLEYLENLGINAIHVMPVSEFEGNSSWGYNPNFYFAPDKYYGAKDDLKKFVDECHKRKILVFNDVVLNHAFYSNVMARMYWNSTLNRPANDNPWFNATHKMVRNQAGWWGADWNHESEHTQIMVDRILDFWLQEYKFDGFRFDFTKGFGQTEPNDFPSGDDWASSYNQLRIDLLKRMVNGMWTRNPGSVAIFEHLAESAEDKVLADHGILMWSGVGHHNDIKGFILGYNGDNTNIYNSGVYNAPGRNFTFANWMSYAESHDEQRLGYELMQFGNGIFMETDTIIKVQRMIDRLKIAAAYNLLLPGPRMIWQFQELGYDVDINFNGRTGEKPVRWWYYDNPKRRELHGLMSKLFYLRNNFNLYATTPDYGNIGLGAGNITTPRRMELHDGNGNYVIVIANLNTALGHTITPNYKTTGTWYRHNGGSTDGSSFAVNTLSDTYFLNPSEVQVLTNFEIPSINLLSIKVMLQGAYNGTNMNNALGNLIPKNEPFSKLNYTHFGRGGGETITHNVWSITGDNAIVDWVLVELRDEHNPSQIISTRSALLQRDGDVVELDGVSPLSFFVKKGNYRIAVKHRNHLGIMTDGVISFN